MFVYFILEMYGSSFSIILIICIADDDDGNIPSRVHLLPVQVQQDCRALHEAAQ